MRSYVPIQNSQVKTEAQDASTTDMALPHAVESAPIFWKYETGSLTEFFIRFQDGDGLEEGEEVEEAEAEAEVKNVAPWSS